MNLSEQKNTFLGKLYIVLIFIFLFAPIAVLIFFSFNPSNSTVVFDFSKQESAGAYFKWYKELFRDSETLGALKNTLILAVSSSIISTLLGTAACYGLFRMRSKRFKGVLMSVTQIPMINPDIITGISFTLMFVFVGGLLKFSNSLSFFTMLIAHVTFSLPYVILQVMPKFNQMDRALPEAALDLGCTPSQTFFKVELPEIIPGVLTGLIMAFTLSLDDFVISYFTQGNDFQTLPILIYNMTKKVVKPKIYALATIIFFAILVLLILLNIESLRASKKEDTSKKRKKALSASGNNGGRHGGRLFKPIAAVLAGVLVVSAVVVTAVKSANRELVLNVYNWGEYMSLGDDDSLNCNDAFEEWYYNETGVKVKVNYTTYDSNESLRAKLESGAASYDVIIPSDYMISYFIENDMLLPLDFSNIPNFENIEEGFRNLYYDPENLYSVPYSYGMVGIIYDANKVDESDIGTWDLMWNEKYSGDILQFANSRDAFGTAMYRLGIDVNTEDEALWKKSLDSLMEQKPLIKSWVMDQVFNMMESGEAAIAPYYAGDYFTMLDNQADSVDLRFYYPTDSDGNYQTNLFVDAMCIPTCCQNKELAEAYINFMLSEEPAIANAEYIYYASPNSAVYTSEEYIDYIGDETYEILYPEGFDFHESYDIFAFRNLPQKTLNLLNNYWEDMRIN